MAKRESASHINTGIYKHAEKRSGVTPPKTYAPVSGKIGGKEVKGMLKSKDMEKKLAEHETHMREHHKHTKKHLDHLEKMMGHHSKKGRGRPRKEA